MDLFSTHGKRSNLLLLLFHHLNKEKEDNEYDKIIQWILNDAYLQRNL